MAHHIYNTEGYVLESSPTGEANKMFSIFTRELGMVRAAAQGVRLQKSKLRFSLQDFTHVQLSLVRGKDIWRITNAKGEENLYLEHSHNKAAIKVIAHIFLLVRRLVRGEEKNEELFDILFQAFRFLKSTELTPDQNSAFECILVLQILHNLGYGGSSAELSLFITTPMSIELLEKMGSVKKIAYQEINRSLKETQL